MVGSISKDEELN